MKSNMLNLILKGILSAVIVIGNFNILGQESVKAVSESGVVIALAQTGGSGSGTASQEIIGLYNSGANDVEVTNWCISYSTAASGTQFSKLVCLDSGDEDTGLWLSSGGWSYFGTTQLLEKTGWLVDFVYSAGMAGSGGHIRLTDKDGLEVDRLGWGAALLPEGSAAVAPPGGQVLSRKISIEPVDTENNAQDFESVSLVVLEPSGIYEKVPIVDLCSNLEGVQELVPEGMYLSDLNLCEPTSVLESTPLIVTEIYANAPSYDTGQEFIEIHNPNSEPINTEGYILQAGPSYTQEVVLPSNTINPGEYLAISDLQSGIVLPNTTGNIRVIAPSGDIVSESSVYVTPPEEESWALVDGAWSYTNQLTPEAPNEPHKELAPEAEEQSDTGQVASAISLAPCPIGKVRNPATNRCRTVGSTASQLLACDEDEYRSVETNRCRKTVTVSSALTPCRTGQIRNPETNRCRSITASSEVRLEPCREGQERNPETNRCRKVQAVSGVAGDGELSMVEDVAVPVAGGYALGIVALVSIGVVIYGVYEWRNEISRLVSRLKIIGTGG